MAAYALAKAGLLHAYGHASIRCDVESFWVTPSKPLGLVSPADALIKVPLDGPLPDGVLGEVRIHREIYRRQPDTHAVVRAMPQNAMVLAAYGIVPQPRHGFGSYFAALPIYWSDPQLLRTDEQAALLADMVVAAGTRAAIMRGNGTVVHGRSIQEAVVLTWYLEDMARIDLEGRKAGLTGPILTADECEKRAVWNGAILDRMWDYLTSGYLQ
jgi:HCOMODA/2-hydroxy-3-carboxy-muconic semialdehyde decarboxylase